ncbi:hypothetical protein Cni_G15640 [Canna indica]|uniref:DUF674 family protein n=1 Tax=Canna indica TaxID=4628 RepID=A0AAQ3KGG6_9LILI|nr:hypothetical protein Cni_G15640 [Canna indica]
MAATKLSLKLLIDRSSNKVLFAEAGKEVVDFLLGFLTLPLAAVIKLLRKDGMVGCIADLYDTLNSLDGRYFQSKRSKKFISLTASRSSGAANGLLLPLIPPPSSASSKKRFRYAKIVPVEVDTSGGFVKGVVTYTIMDNLSVSPMSNISSITLLSKFDVRDLGDLEERTANLGFDEGLELLRASLQSKTVLTDVFLSKKKGSYSTGEFFAEPPSSQHHVFAAFLSLQPLVAVEARHMLHRGKLQQKIVDDVHKIDLV